MFNSPLDILNWMAQQQGYTNNPTQKQYLSILIDALKTGNTQQAEALADNICKSYGMTREQMVQMAQNKILGRK